MGDYSLQYIGAFEFNAMSCMSRLGSLQFRPHKQMQVKTNTNNTAADVDGISSCALPQPMSKVLSKLPTNDHSRSLIRRRPRPNDGSGSSSLSPTLSDGGFLVVVQPAFLYRRPDTAHVLLHVFAIELRRFCVCGAVRVRIMQEALDGRENGRDVVRG